MSRYVEVWQTWQFLADAPEPQSTPQQSAPIVVETDRQKLQRLRIQRRMALHELAEDVQMDVARLCAYERGQIVLSTEDRQRLFRRLS